MRDFHLPGRSRVFATGAMAATSHPVATLTALEILRAGGSAADAAIAAALTLGICEPPMTGLGGDCFALVRPAPGDGIVALNGSGRAPAATDAARLRGDGHGVWPTAGAHAVTLPGAVDGFCTLHARYGRLGLDQVLAPAIRAAEDGVPVAPRVALDWARNAGTLTGRARDLFLIDGAPPAPGQVFRAPGQAEVLRRIAAEGRDGFYAGEVAEDLIASLTAADGLHAADDFAAVAADWGTPVEGDYRGATLTEHPPNGQGVVALLLAAILQQFDVASMDPFGADRAHVEAEATKLAYDARDRFLSDPDHMTELHRFTAPATAERLAGLIDMRRAMPDPAPLTEAVHRDTVYLTVVDADGMAVSLIYSIFSSFGSGLASDRFGVLFHNRGAGFSIAEGHPNEAGPGKRPLHTIIPAFLRTAGGIMPFGVMGGAYQATGHARFVSNIVDFGLSPQDAIDAPRAFATHDGLRIERGYAEAVRADLAGRGHHIVVPDEPIGGAQAILIDEATGLLEGASDPRKDGCAMGY